MRSPGPVLPPGWVSNEDHRSTLNVLVRMLVADDPDQAVLAARLFEEAEWIAVGLQTLAELVWVLGGSYGVRRDDIVVAIRTIMDTEKVVRDRAAVDAGLSCLEAGGDFADGVVAHEGAWLGRGDVRVVRQESRQGSGRAGTRDPAARLRNLLLRWVR